MIAGKHTLEPLITIAVSPYFIAQGVALKALGDGMYAFAFGAQIWTGRVVEKDEREDEDAA